MKTYVMIPHDYIHDIIYIYIFYTHILYILCMNYVTINLCVMVSSV
jgi:hypothetical protein